MTIPIFALVIGVSKYQSVAFDPLPAARNDALSLARALVGWGVPESNIFLLCSNFETTETLELCLKKLAARKEPFQLLFYFCGHGYRTLGLSPQSFLIFSDTEIVDGQCKNGSNLEQLFHELTHLNTTSIYLFIDACHLRLNSVMNPKLKEEIQGKKDSKKTLFCLLSSGIFPSFESVKHQCGYFTEALIKALSVIRHSDRSPIALFQAIQMELVNNELPEPEMYNIGTSIVDFLPPLSCYVKDRQLIRQEVIADMQDLFVRHRDKILLCVGPKGIGKTTLARQQSSNMLQAYSIFLDHSCPTFQKQLIKGLVDSKLIPHQPASISLDECLDVLEADKPHVLLIFDSVDVKDLKEMLKFFAKRSFRIICFSTQSCANEDLQEYFIPPFSFEETRLFIEESCHGGLTNVTPLHHLITKGNPQKLKQSVYNFKDEEIKGAEIDKIKKAIGAIYSCGLFINEELFRKTFDIDTKTLVILEKMGLLSYENDCWYPHDFLIEIAESDQVRIDRDLALTYWCSQLEELPDHFKAALNLVLTIKCFGYEQKIDPSLKNAFKILYHHKALDILKESATIFSANDITPSSTFLAEVLLEMHEFGLVKALLGEKILSCSNLQACSTYCHLLWRTGLFSECIGETTRLINALSHPIEKISFYLHRGASHYFLGNWDEAKIDFSFVNENAKDPKSIGWSRCLLGTITGVRGINVKVSKELIESGIRTLIKNGDTNETWIGWNNLGEITCKAGELRSSSNYLQKALEISEKANNPNMILETLRNFLQLELQQASPNRSEIDRLLERIEYLLETSIETYEMMQIYNTLCTVYYYLKNYDQAQYYLKKATPLTIQSKEYHIYTLSNLSLLSKAIQLKDESTMYLQQAIKLANDGNNLFAVQQIERDHSY